MEKELRIAVSKLTVSGFTLLAHGGTVLADEQKSIPEYVGWSLELGKSWII